MKKVVKSYLAMSSFGYRIVCMIVLPVFNLVISGFFLHAFREQDELPSEFVLCAFVVWQDVLLDYWMFGGICHREGNGLEYMKTSKRGESVLKWGVVADLLRRFIYLMGFGVFCFVFTADLQILVTVLLAYIVTVCALNVTRYSVVWQVHIFVGILASILLIVSALLCWLICGNSQNSPGVFLAELIGAGIVAVAVSIATVRHMSYRMKGSYYEK